MDLDENSMVSTKLSVNVCVMQTNYKPPPALPGGGGFDSLTLIMQLVLL